MLPRFARVAAQRGLVVTLVGAGLLGCGTQGELLVNWKLVNEATAEDNADASADVDQERAPADGLFTLTVHGGVGSGTYPAGATVDVFADLVARRDILVRWEGDRDVLTFPDEWHSPLVMPAHDVTLSAMVQPRPVELAEFHHMGVTAVPKVVRYAVPENPRGILMFFHGTGGSSDVLMKDEVSAFVLAAVDRGFAVVASEAEEAARVRALLEDGLSKERASSEADLNGDGKIRWDVRPALGNTDLQNLSALLSLPQLQAMAGAHVPVFAVGMSNGGAMSIALGALKSIPQMATAFPALRIAAATSYCADGPAWAAERTTTPTAWLMCAQDGNGQVSNADARTMSETLAQRGVPTLFDLHPPSPLYSRRFARIEGIDASTSEAMVEELAAAGHVDDNGMLVDAPDAMARAVRDTPTAYPTLKSLPGKAALKVYGQVKASYADHQFFSDWSHRTLDFLIEHGLDGAAAVP